MEGSFKCKEELRLGDVHDLGLDEVLNFSTVHLLQDAVTTNIKRLGNYYYYSSFKVYAVKDYDTYLASQDLLAKNSP